MQRHFDQELEELKNEILRMCSLTEEAIFKAVVSLRDLSFVDAQGVIDSDKEIDLLELSLEEKCLYLLALRQPVAVDLRFITMAMKITTDLERIADLAVDIAQRVMELADKPLLKPLVDIPKLTVLAQRMTHQVVEAFIKKDPALAEAVIRMDPEADALRNLVQDELIYDYMAKDQDTAPRAVPLLLIARHLERICDHATNIAEEVIFMCSAEVVKHHPEKLQMQEE